VYYWIVPQEYLESSDHLGLPTSAQFATTHWSVILKAGDVESPNADEALEKLCRAYWYPLYAFVRRSGHDRETAQDLTQGFFERLIQKNYLKQVDSGKGRFRSFLLVALKHFLANEWDRVQTSKRGGQYRFVTLNEDWVKASERQDEMMALTPERLYERRWALLVLDTVKRKLVAESTAAGKGEVFEALRIYLTGETDKTPYADVAARLNMSSDAVRKAVERLRRRYGELLREEIAHTVGHPSEIEDEIRHLRQVLSE
jgi:RNA polymerase sigma-70 factor (ECF subfamily)